MNEFLQKWDSGLKDWQTPVGHEPSFYFVTFPRVERMSASLCARERARIFRIRIMFHPLRG